MKKRASILITLLLFFCVRVYADINSVCTFRSAILNKVCKRLRKLWHEGNTDVYLTGYAWHNRWAYTREAIRSNHYNELSWGGGLGKGMYDEAGDWHGIYAVSFLDSHKNVQPNIGYSFLKIKSLSPKFRLGAGVTMLVTMRSDLFDGYPFPGAAPLLSFEYGPYSLVASYVPGKTNIGNVLFLYFKISLS